MPSSEQLKLPTILNYTLKKAKYFRARITNLACGGGGGGGVFVWMALVMVELVVVVLVVLLMMW